MKNMQRVEQTIEQGESSVFSSSPSAPDPPSGAQPERSELVSCPTCGSADMELLAQALPGLDLTLLKQDTQDGPVHLYRSASGEWWICKPSLHMS